MAIRRINLAEHGRLGKGIFLGVAILVAVLFLYTSNRLIQELASQERERMNIWAQATQRLAQADIDTDLDFLLAIIQQNNTIPVLVTDTALNILQYRNFPLPDKEPDGVLIFSDLTEKNQKYLNERLNDAIGSKTVQEAATVNPHFIEVTMDSGESQYIYYEDSLILKRLSIYPYLQVGITIILLLIIYFAIIYAKRAEQNRVWVGLSKETAHQLGTPISSLMAWNQYLDATGTDANIVTEIEKDVSRLSVIAERFSKIGSRPELQLEYINDVVAHALDYMKSRISSRVDIQMHLCDDDSGVMLSVPLFAWVMENLTKNAVDAMDGIGKIDISISHGKDKVYIDIKDTGKGILKKNFQRVFRPGYTTKTRGWGLGLTLVKRIIEDYHDGAIYVKESEPGRGTTFRIELPLAV